MGIIKSIHILFLAILCGVFLMPADSGATDIFVKKKPSSTGDRANTGLANKPSPSSRVANPTGMPLSPGMGMQGVEIPLQAMMGLPPCSAEDRKLYDQIMGSMEAFDENSPDANKLGAQWTRYFSKQENIDLMVNLSIRCNDFSQ